MMKVKENPLSTLLSSTRSFPDLRALTFTAKGWAHIYVNGISKWIWGVMEHLNIKN